MPARDAHDKPGSNGRQPPRSVAELARQKKVPVKWLREDMGLKDLGGGRIGIPYFDWEGSELFLRQRLPVAEGRRFEQPRGVALEPYGLWRLSDVRKGGMLFLTEGESDAWPLWLCNFPGLGLPGVDAVGALDREHLEGFDKLYLLPDNDTPGERMPEKLAERLAKIGWQGRLYRVRLPAEHKDVSAWYAAGPESFTDELAAAIQVSERVAIPAAGGKGQRQAPGQAGGTAKGTRGAAADKEVQLVTAPLSALAPRPVRWLAEGRIALGKLFIAAGDGGHGKSMLVLYLAACLSVGKHPFGVEGPDPLVGETLLIQCEDDWEDTVVPRLLALGADMRRIQWLKGVRSGDDDDTDEEEELGGFTLLHYKALEKKLRDCPDIKLVVIDPAGAYIGAGVDDHKESELRALLGPLARLAARRGVAVVLVKHFNKAPTARAVARISGNTGYVNTVRAAFVVLPHEEDSDRALFLPVKFNGGRKPKGLAFRRTALSCEEVGELLRPYADLTDEDRRRIGQMMFRLTDWEEVDVGADRHLADAMHADRGPNKVQKCADWLKEFLARYAYPDPEIQAAAEKEGFTFDNVRKAKAVLRSATPPLRSSPKGFQGVWWNGFGPPDKWELRPPPDPPHSPQSHQSGENAGENHRESSSVGRVGSLGSESSVHLYNGQECEGEL